jgi:hypothetical protein
LQLPNELFLTSTKPGNKGAPVERMDGRTPRATLDHARATLDHARATLDHARATLDHSRATQLPVRLPYTLRNVRVFESSPRSHKRFRKFCSPLRVRPRRSA